MKGRRTPDASRSRAASGGAWHAVLRHLALGAAALMALGCPRRSSDTGGGGATPPPKVDPVAAPAQNVAMDLIAGFDDCTLGHLGPLVDLGDPTARAAVTARGMVAPESLEREGATWVRATSKAMTLGFVLEGLPGAYKNSVVAARVRGGAAKSVSVYLNDKAVGSWPLTKGETRVVEARGADESLLPGENVLGLRFNGAGRAGGEELAELDWVHIGSPAPDGAYAAPTRGDALVTVSVGAVPRRAVSLRAPGYLRCGGELPASASLEAYVGLAGAADGELEVRLLRDRLPPLVLASMRLGPAEADAWRPLRVPLGDLGPKGSFGAIVLAAKSVAKGGRVLFAEPRIVAAAPASAPHPLPAGRGAVLVVLGSLAPRGLALYGGARALPELGALAAAGVTFDAHRASSPVATGALAAMLTGVEARALGVAEFDRKLSKAVTTLADAARQGGAATAMFTANPLTGAAFGFERGWETFEAHSPTEETPATSLFDSAATWIEAHKEGRFLVVIHARGGHPPWDVTAEELKKLPPEGYPGGLDPKHAAELLSKARRVPPALRFGEADRARAWALYDTALSAHDAALGRLMTALRASGRDADTTVVVTGDAASNEADHVPFGDGETLDEASLNVPLVLRPVTAGRGAPPAGTHATGPTTGVDVARTLLAALGLEAPQSFGGVDLWQTATRTDAPPRPLVAALARRYALRWGELLLTGVEAREPKLCNLALEPVCVTDVRQTHPLAAEALHRAAFDLVLRPAPLAPAEPPTIDPATAAGLKAWGR